VTAFEATGVTADVFAFKDSPSASLSAALPVGEALVAVAVLVLVDTACCPELVVRVDVARGAAGAPGPEDVGLRAETDGAGASTRSSVAGLLLDCFTGTWAASTTRNRKSSK